MIDLSRHISKIKSCYNMTNVMYHVLHKLIHNVIDYINNNEHKSNLYIKIDITLNSKP